MSAKYTRQIKSFKPKHYLRKYGDTDTHVHVDDMQFVQIR